MFYAWLGLMSMALFSMMIVACQEEEAGAPVISGVRRVDPSKGDSTFTAAFPGNLILIEGVNFVDVTAIRLNGVAVPYNPTYITAITAIVRIPADLPLQGVNPSLPNTIEMETQHGKTSYQFSFLSPVPTLSKLMFEFPAVVGGTMTIAGSNFYKVQQVVFTVNENQVAVTSFTVNETYDAIQFVIPTGGDQDGRITVVTESGSASIPYKASAKPLVTALSTDMPVPGDSLTIYGASFYGVTRVELPGGVVVTSQHVHVTSAKDKISFVMPDLSDMGTVKVVTTFGESSSALPINDVSKVIYDHDGIGAFAWHDGVYVTAGVLPAVAKSGFTRFAGTIPDNTYWWEANAFTLNDWPSSIPATTAIDQLYLKFNFYTGETWKNSGYVQVSMTDANGGNHFVNWQPWTTGTVPVGQWIEARIPLTAFQFSSMSTYADWQQLNKYLVVMVGNHDGAAIKVNFCVDDLRIGF